MNPVPLTTPDEPISLCETHSWKKVRINGMLAVTTSFLKLLVLVTFVQINSFAIVMFLQRNLSVLVLLVQVNLFKVVMSV